MISDIESNIKFTIDIRDAINLFREAWDSVSEPTIRNCWAHTGIFSDVRSKNLKTNVEFKSDDVKELGLLLQNLTEKKETVALTAEDYVTADAHEDTEEPSCDESIVRNILGTTEPESDDDSMQESVEAPHVTFNEAELALRQLTLYFERNIENSSAHDSLWAIRQEFNRLQPATHQTTIDSYFINDSSK